MSNTLKIGLGGGCHWCTEAIFQSLIGVEKVDQGWICSESPNDGFSEAIVVHFCTETICLEKLIQVHLLTHASTSNHSMRTKYRSAVYYFDSLLSEQIKKIMAVLQTGFNEKIITKVLPYVEFKKNSEKYLNYYLRNPDAAFCKTHIHPKLQQLFKTHKQIIKENQS